jgi:hypothetical protein
MTKLEPKYYEDILKQLRSIDGVPLAIFNIDEITSGIMQHSARAADEIERLRDENKMLKKEVRNLKLMRKI